MEHYSAIKRKEILMHAPTQMYFENIMPSEISQTQKNKYWMRVHLYEISKIGKFIHTESKLDTTRAWERGK